MSLQFSTYDLRVQESESGRRIYDIIRKKYVVLTPGEWVRQHIIHYLITDHGFPKSLISVEKQLTVNTLTRRTDIVLYNHAGKPVLIVECKASDIKLSQAAVDQAARYNLTLQVPWLWVTNGVSHVWCHISHEEGNWRVEGHLPPVSELLR